MKQQDTSAKDYKYYNSLLPASACVICAKTLSEVGGKRILATGLRGFDISDQRPKRQNKPHYVATPRLIEDEEIYLRVWGDKKIFTDAVVDRIRATYRSGFRPWMCQAKGCGDRACVVCGMAMRHTPCCGILHDDGESRYQMLIPLMSYPCTNVDCENFG